MQNTISETVLIGRVGQDPLFTVTKNKKLLLSFSVATTQKYKKVKTSSDPKQKPELEIVEDLSWHRVRLWGIQAELGQKAIKQGDLVYVKGRIKYNEWTDGQSVRHYTTEIIADHFMVVNKKARKSPVETSETLENLDIDVEFSDTLDYYKFLDEEQG